ncbi:MAG: Mut7-C RNAse domain-containing protein [Betaproteobacteria bacterium]
MKFIADVMLGRLAKRMRLLGFDVLYDRTLSDNEILRLSLEQGRVILTRDTELAARPLAANNVFVKSDDVQDQIRQVLATLPSDESPPPLTRCSECNHPLNAVAKQEIRDSVPHYVYDKYDAFLRCSSCRRVYWRGTHVSRMERSGMVTMKKPGHR